MNGEKQFIWACVPKYFCSCFALRTSSFLVVFIETLYAISMEVGTSLLLNFVISSNADDFSNDFKIPKKRAENVLECE